MKNTLIWIAGLILSTGAMQARAAADWQELDAQLYAGTGFKQYSGGIDQATGNPTGGSTTMTMFQLNYSNGWKYGGTYFYFQNGFDHNDYRMYTQGWEYLSLNKIFNANLSFGPVQEIRIAPGWQFSTSKDYYAGDQNQGTAGQIGAKVMYPGVDTEDLFLGLDFVLKIPGFDFAGLTAGVYQNIQADTKYTLQPSVDFYYRSTFYIGPTHWKAEGYIQWYGSRRSRVNPDYDAVAYVSTQDALLLDTGLLLYERPDQFYTGVQLQWSHNTYGVKTIPGVSKATNEFFPQIMLEWVF
jgi:nucleoside-specific outer membrane channel protein Tsx